MCIKHFDQLDYVIVDFEIEQKIKDKYPNTTIIEI